MRKSPSPLTKINCDFCGEVKEIDNYALTKRKNHFCSRKCFYEFWHKTRSKNYICHYCGKNFERANSFIKSNSHKMYCSTVCKHAGKKGQSTWSKGKRIGHNPKISGSSHWNWKGGEHPLQLAVRKSWLMSHWRLNVFSRDSFSCVECGVKGGDLQSHHITQFKVLFNEFLTKYNREEDLFVQLLNFKKFWSLKNGKTLCKKCHIEWHRKKRKIIKI